MQDMITDKGVAILRFMWQMAFNLLTSFYIPGTRITPLALLFFVSFTYLAIQFFVRILGLGSVSDTMNVASRGVGYVANKGRAQGEYNYNVKSAKSLNTQIMATRAEAHHIYRNSKGRG